MTELPLVILSLCAVVVAWSVLVTALDLRCMLRRIDVLLPDAEQAVKEAKRALMHVRRMTARTDAVSRQVEAVALKACEAVSGVVERLDAIKSQAEHSLGRWLGTNGHGAGSGSRSHRRSR